MTVKDNTCPDCTPVMGIHQAGCRALACPCCDKLGIPGQHSCRTAINSVTGLQYEIDAKEAYKARMLELEDENKRLLEANAKLTEALGMLAEPFVVPDDGTHIKCTCGRKGCFDRWFSAGDAIYVVSYPDAAKFQSLKDTRGEKK